MVWWGEGGPINLGALIAHHTPTATSYSGTLWIIMNKTGNERINVTLRRIHKTIFAVEKQQVLHILNVCM